LGELAGLGRAMPNPDLLIGPFLRREAVLSSRIEGTQTDITQLYAFEAGQLSLPGMKSAPPESDTREVMNYVQAQKYGLERVKTLPVSLRLLRELHERLMHGVRGGIATPGEFRRVQNFIGSQGATIGDALYVPPPVNELNPALDAFEKYLHEGNELPPLVRLALIHYQFEAIHPFLDGNGRIGRLLISLLLVNWNLLPIPLLYLSAYFERNRRQYYDLLLAVSERGAWREWIVFFLEGMAAQSKDALVRAKKLQDLQAEWRQKLTRSRASALSLRLADSLFESPIISIPGAQQLLKLQSYRSAKLHVDRLVKAGILFNWESVRKYDASIGAKIFLAPEILRILEPER
jgi:Fic family protein